MNVEEEPETDGRAAGGCVLLAAAAGTGLAVYAISRDLFVILVWVLGAVAIWWAVRKRAHTVNSAPPAPPERGSDEKPQVAVMRDMSHPNRWVVDHPSPWMGAEIDKEAGTT